MEGGIHGNLTPAGWTDGGLIINEFFFKIVADNIRVQICNIYIVGSVVIKKSYVRIWNNL